MKSKSIVVVTGASRGIGRNIALYFAERDYLVIGTGRNQEKLNDLEEELKKLSPTSTTKVMDVTKPTDIENLVSYVLKEYGQIDVWINNAGAFMAIGPTWEVEKEDWINDVQTNLFGTFHSVQAVIPVMLKQKFGRIINLAGGGTIGAFKYGNGYGTSKTGVARFTENLAAELEQTPIKVFALDPGLNDTDMTRYQRDSDVGNQYLSGIESLFEQNIDVPPNQAPEWAFHLSSGDLDAFSGRIVTVYDDIEELKNQVRKGNDVDYLRLRLWK
ncbi:SDR family oxidoreductase [Aquibacillus saliphilus]|uniref:SDR family oxidoreductase n=1 Tax=Aquibacillus saliphilus TaxID=1909422 RepID=UPI001CF08030|nr:SDR family oxidoreductase [Aquibacillus saliphilus]